MPRPRLGDKKLQIISIAAPRDVVRALDEIAYAQGTTRSAAARMLLMLSVRDLEARWQKEEKEDLCGLTFSSASPPAP